MENKSGIEIKDLIKESNSHTSVPISSELTTPKISLQKDNPTGVYDQLNQLFSEQDKQQKEIQEAREVLGGGAENLNDSQVYDLVNEVQYLLDSWLEEFERKVFDGKTLNELLNLEP